MITSTRKSESAKNSMYTFHAGIIILCIITFIMYALNLTPTVTMLISGAILVIVTSYLGIKKEGIFLRPVTNLIFLSFIIGLSIFWYSFLYLKVDVETVLIVANIIFLIIYLENFKKIIPTMVFGIVALVVYDLLIYETINYIQIIVDIIIYVILMRLTYSILVYSDIKRTSSENIFFAMKNILN